MANESPAAVIVDSEGNEVTLKTFDGTTYYLKVEARLSDNDSPILNALNMIAEELVAIRKILSGISE